LLAVNLNASQKLDLNDLKTPRGDAFINEIASIIRYNGHVMITTEDRGGDDCAKYAGENNIGEGRIPRLIAKNLGNLAKEVAKRTDLETVVIIGGDTAVEVIGALGISGVVPWEEISTGAVFSKSIGKARRVNLITKSGGFGEEESIIKIMQYITDHTEENVEEKRPILGITMGDPAGIGPEIAVKALGQKRMYEMCRPLLIGDGGVIQDALRICNLPLRIHSVEDVEEALFDYGCIDLIDLHNTDMQKLEYGKVSAMCGKAAFESVKKAIDLATDGSIDATVTCPINKEAINKAGYHYSGHTEIYAHFTHTKDYTMMLAHENLRVVHVSTHVSLRRACDLVKKERIVKVIQLADGTCRQLGIQNPRIGVAGLNPHAGENGLFGTEEIKEIAPAVKEAQSLGILAEGPVPPDSLYSKALGGCYDIAVAMYHDQGHIPIKIVGFTWDSGKGKWDVISGVNITLGLPVIRTSVDHGTAFEIAGKGIASELSLCHAIEYGVLLSKSKGNG
jgi:4-hydroxythreonine-4-phosphate dehydrogenase